LACHRRLSFLTVSIHAPAWGATNRYTLVTDEQRCFNPRARVGRDLIAHLVLQTSSSFQSTRPRGARRRVLLLSSISTRVSIHAPAWGATGGEDGFAVRVISFNPRARVGRDNGLKRISSAFIVSIHAPAWGATAARALELPRGRCFNPRARVGRDRALELETLAIQMFQSTRPRGARLSSRHWSTAWQAFQSTRPRGARLNAN